MIKDKDYKLHYDNFDKIKVNGVYLIRNLDNNSLKIGMTDNLKRRLKEIGKSFQFCGVIPKLEVEVFIEYKYNYELEQYLHKEFSNNRIQNEWFDIEDILIVLQKLGEFQYNLKCIDNIITKKEMKTNNYIINPNVITKNDGEINLIKLDNEFFNLDNYTFKKIGTEGFVIYTYLLMRQSNSCSCEVTIKGMLSFFNRDLKNAPTVSYRKDRISKVGNIKEKKTILKYLDRLEEFNYIEIQNKPNRVDDVFFVKCNKLCNSKNGFVAISDELFTDYIHKIGHIGWAILVLLTKLHNNEFGSVSSVGFANPGEERISKIVNRNIETTRAYLYLLDKLKLIKIENQDPIFKGVDTKGMEYFEFISNHYIVKNRLSDNKYYLNMNSKQNK